MKIYISFGQVHTHSVNGKTFDKDCLAEIDCESHREGRDIAFEYFGDKFSISYTEESVKEALPYFNRGIIPVENKTP